MGGTSAGGREGGGVLVVGGVGINVGGSGKSRMSLSSASRREDLRDRLDVLLVVRCRGCG
jgi:hypothetical protein